MNILQNISLKNYNTFGISVNAKRFISIDSVYQLQQLLKIEKELFLISGGSNMLLTKDIYKLVVHIDFKGISIDKEDDNNVYITVNAGENWHEFVLWCVSQNYGGIENLSLIPGNVGAAPMQNIGAYGVELKNVFYSLEAVEMATGDVQTFTASECEFGYRESVFKRKLKGQFIISSVTLNLSKTADLNTSYGAIEQELERLNISSPTIQDVSKAVINIRQSKLPNPKELGNSGSFFKNPVVPTSKYEELKANHPNIPGYPAGEKTKLAAGWLIEQCGWKGKVVGNTGSHKMQALVLVNYGGATGVEIYQLSEQIMQSVYNTFGVQLEQEVNVY